MSFGSYSQPFNPTANTGGKLPGAILGGGPAQLPGAQDPNNQQYFQQMRQNMEGMDDALQKIEQGPQNQFGGKSGSMAPGGMISGGSKYGTMNNAQRFNNF